MEDPGSGTALAVEVAERVFSIFKSSFDTDQKTIIHNIIIETCFFF